MDFANILRDEANGFHPNARLTPAQKSMMRSAATEIDQLKREIEALQAEIQRLSLIAKY